MIRKEKERAVEDADPTAVLDVSDGYEGSCQTASAPRCGFSFLVFAMVWLGHHLVPFLESCRQCRAAIESDNVGGEYQLAQQRDQQPRQRGAVEPDETALVGVDVAAVREA